MKLSNRSTIMVTIIAIIAIILTITIVLYKIPACTNNKQKTEHFVIQTPNPMVTLDNNYNKQLYQTNGIKKCTVLNVKDSAIASNYIDNLRIRTWQPAQSNPLYTQYDKDKNTHDYCYYFVDSNNFIPSDNTKDPLAPLQDPLATISNCSRNSGLFKDTPFIDDVFLDSNYDVTNTLPYDKCVIKINKQKATPSNLTRFWEDNFKSNDAFCQGFVKTVNHEVNRYKTMIGDLVNKVTPYRRRHQSISVLDQKIATVAQSNVQLQGKTIPKKEKELYSLQKHINKENDKLTNQIKSYTSDVFDKYGILVTKNSYYNESSNNLLVLDESHTAFKDAFTYSNQLKMKCDKELQGATKQFDGLAKIHTDLRTSYNVVYDELSQCNKEVFTINSNISRAQVLQKELLETHSNVSKELNECQLRRKPLPPEESYLKDALNQHYNAFLSCEKERAQVSADVGQVERQNKAIQDEIDDIKKRCRNQKVSYDMIQVDVDRAAAQNLVTNQQRACETAQSLRKRKMEIIDDIANLQMQYAKVVGQNKSCKRQTEICGCYKKVGEEVWNDNGISGNRAYTTSGRIDFVRGVIGDGKQHTNGFVRWHVEGKHDKKRWKTPVYRLLNTKRDRGDSDNYVEVDGIINTNGKLVKIEAWMKQ